ncbi:MAG: glycoside hydrolase family 88 protein [Candidatus Acidiferrales bacterium]|jgi:unsaturated rhamnogalacturonyl hydrolase
MKFRSQSVRCSRTEPLAAQSPRRVRALLMALAAFCIVAACSSAVRAQDSQLPWSQRMANSTLQRWPDGHFAPPNAHWVWNYEMGTLLQGVESVWYSTADGDYFKYIKDSVDQFLSPDGTSIRTYDPYNGSQEFALDDVRLGNQLLLLYAVTQDKRYYNAVTLLRRQLAQQPRTPEGGFWHKDKYPQEMWLDGLYMAEPFYAQYAHTFNEPQDFADITKQFVLTEARLRDPKTGLLYHGWDESRVQPWADKTTGDSPIFWSRAMGWYIMALVDTLPYYPANDPGRAKLVAILNRLAAAIVKYQDPATGLWYQVTDEPTAPGNYLESSAACMFVYALEKGVREGFLPAHYLDNATRAYQGVLKQFVTVDANGAVTLTRTVKGVGLAADMSRDDSFHYYVTTPVIDNDPKGIGAFLMASVEIESQPLQAVGKGKTLLFDGWFNSQTRKDASGQLVPYHYKEHDKSNQGYSFFAHIWHTYGVTTSTLTVAPTLKNLAHANIYVVVPPDVPLWNPKPNYIQAGDAAQVAQWVRQGGVLLIIANDPLNTDLPGLDRLAKPFGIQFQNVTRFHQTDTDPHSLGKMDVPVGPIFHSAHKFFMKDTTDLSLSGDAKSALTYNNIVVMASAKYGKGTVFAVVDPWIYNEYTDGRKPHMEGFDNYAGGWELVRWLIEQVPPAPHTAAKPASPATPTP